MKATNKQKQKFAHYLNQDEKMLYFFEFSKIYLLNLFLYYLCLFLVCSLPIIILLFYILGINYILLTSWLFSSSIIVFLKIYILQKGTQFILTDKRAIIHKGYFQVTLITAPYTQVSHIEVEQNILERFFYKYGTLIIHTAGLNKKEIIFKNISNPFEIKNLIYKLINNQKDKTVQKLKPVES